MQAQPRGNDEQREQKLISMWHRCKPGVQKMAEGRRGTGYQYNNTRRGRREGVLISEKDGGASPFRWEQ